MTRHRKYDIIGIKDHETFPLIFVRTDPGDLDQGITVKGVQVGVLNALGAGDAFMAGFLGGWLRDEGYERALGYANVGLQIPILPPETVLLLHLQRTR